eukprot:229627-Pelagomonas_calceolata.AAC.3
MCTIVNSTPHAHRTAPRRQNFIVTCVMSTVMEHHGDFDLLGAPCPSLTQGARDGLRSLSIFLFDHPRVPKTKSAPGNTSTADHVKTSSAYKVVTHHHSAQRMFSCYSSIFQDKQHSPCPTDAPKQCVVTRYWRSWDKWDLICA